VTFSDEQLREIEYASLLHDFGKIGVRENVLGKSRKLHDHDMALLRARFDFIHRSLDLEALRRQFDSVTSGGSEQQMARIAAEVSEQRARLESAWGAICAANEPTVVDAGDFSLIAQIAKNVYLDLQGREQPWLTDDEVTSLSITRGSLTPREYLEISRHVDHTIRFLSQIPWGASLGRVAEIAGAHHERLDGSGYPRGLAEHAIPLQAKMMSIADIFDALTANDRPYKPAVSVDNAVGIVERAAHVHRHLDPELVRIFVATRVWDGSDGTAR